MRRTIICGGPGRAAHFSNNERPRRGNKWIKGGWTHVSEMYKERNTRIDSVA